MTAIAVIIAFAVPGLTGFFVVRALTCRIHPRLSVALQAALGVGLGVGGFSQAMFVWLQIFGQAGRNYVFAETAVAAVIIIITSVLQKWSRRRPRLHGIDDLTGTKSAGDYPSDDVVSELKGSTFQAETAGQHWLFVVMAIAFIAIAAARFGVHTYERPFGGWDAAGIWNLKARFLTQGTPDWHLIFSSQLPGSHADYPLLVPLTIARTWAYLGRQTPVAAAAVAASYTALTVMVVGCGAAAMRGAPAGWMAVAALVTCSSFSISAASQSADVEVGFYILATGTCWLLHRPGASWAYPLAGAFAGLAAWSKIEGQSFLGLMLIAVAVDGIMTRRATKRWQWRSASLFMAGLAIPALVVLFFKSRLAPPSTNVNTDPKSIVTDLLTASRYWLVMRWLPVALLSAAPSVLALAIYAAFAGVRPCVGPRQSRKNWLLFVGVVAAQMVGFFFVYVTTPSPIPWHIRTSALRLFLQIWPATVLLWAAIIPVTFSKSDDSPHQKPGF